MALVCAIFVPLPLHLLKLLLDFINLAFERIANNLALVVFKSYHLKKLVELESIVKEIAGLVIHSVLKKDVKAEKRGKLGFHSQTISTSLPINIGISINFGLRWCLVPIDLSPDIVLIPLDTVIALEQLFKLLLVNFEILFVNLTF